MSGPELFRATRLWDELICNFSRFLPVSRHRLGFRYYADTFTSEEAIDWLSFHLSNHSEFSANLSRKQIIRLLETMMVNGVFFNVKPDHKCTTPVFKDTGALYRFRDLLKLFDRSESFINSDLCAYFNETLNNTDSNSDVQNVLMPILKQYDGSSQAFQNDNNHLSDQDGCRNAVLSFEINVWRDEIQHIFERSLKNCLQSNLNIHNVRRNCLECPKLLQYDCFPKWVYAALQYVNCSTGDDESLTPNNFKTPSHEIELTLLHFFASQSPLISPDQACLLLTIFDEMVDVVDSHDAVTWATDVISTIFDDVDDFKPAFVADQFSVPNTNENESTLLQFSDFRFADETASSELNVPVFPSDFSASLPKSVSSSAIISQTTCAPLADAPQRPIIVSSSLSNLGHVDHNCVPKKTNSVVSLLKQKVPDIVDKCECLHIVLLSLPPVNLCKLRAILRFASAFVKRHFGLNSSAIFPRFPSNDTGTRLNQSVIDFNNFIESIMSAILPKVPGLRYQLLNFLLSGHIDLTRPDRSILSSHFSHLCLESTTNAGTPPCDYWKVLTLPAGRLMRSVRERLHGEQLGRRNSQGGKLAMGGSGFGFLATSTPKRSSATMSNFNQGVSSASLGSARTAHRSLTYLQQSSVARSTSKLSQWQQDELLGLLDSLLVTPYLTKKERTNKLKQFSRMYPEIYVRRFPMAAAPSSQEHFGDGLTRSEGDLTVKRLKDEKSQADSSSGTSKFRPLQIINRTRSFIFDARKRDVSLSGSEFSSPCTVMPPTKRPLEPSYLSSANRSSDSSALVSTFREKLKRIK